jgi:hypothetical protein
MIDISDNNTKRILLFLFGCIPVRLAIAYYAYTLQPKGIKILSFIFLIIGTSMAYLALANKRLSGPETFGENIWWTPHMRIVHATMYLLFFILAFINYPKSYIILFIDVILGLSAFSIHLFIK